MGVYVRNVILIAVVICCTVVNEGCLCTGCGDNDDGANCINIRI